MNNFEFRNPTKLIFGKGTIQKLSNEIGLDKKILITFGGGSVKTNGVYEQVKEALRNHMTFEFWGIEPNPKYETLVKALDVIQKNDIDFILSVGGGSVLDGTKFIAAAACYEDGEPWDLIMNNRLIKNSLPIASVMTLPATGSEMNSGAVISRLSTQEKFAFNSIYSFPKFSILDPETTFSLPKFQVACGIIDTFVHTVEQYMTSCHESILMDRWAEGILQTLVEVGVPAVENTTNYEVMSNFMLSATMALNGFTSMGVTVDWATHLIGHEITALYGLTHGVTLAMVYPSLLRVMRDEKRGKILQYGARVWGITEGDIDTRIDQIIDVTERFFNSLGIATKLSEHGMTDEHFSTIVERFRSRNQNLGERGIVTPDKVELILAGIL